MVERSEKQTITLTVSRIVDLLREAYGTESVAGHTLALLVLKFVSDRGWRPEDPEAEPRDQSGFVVHPDADFQRLAQIPSLASMGERLNRALHNLQQSNAVLEGMFEGIDFNLFRRVNADQAVRALSQVMALLSDAVFNYHVEDKDALENAAFACEAALACVVQYHGKQGSQWSTPVELGWLVAGLLRPKSGETVADPCCGMGSILLAMGKFARQQTGGNGCPLFGMERNGSVVAVARMSMLLHAEPDFHIDWGDTLQRPMLTDARELRTFDMVVANPPMALKDWDYERAMHDPFGRYRWGLPPRGSADYAFISHMLTALRPQGRMAVVVSPGVLFRGGNEGRIREQLLKENLIDAVIALPAKLLAGSGVPLVVLLFKRERADEDILFIDASEGFKAGRAQNSLREEDIEVITSVYHDREDQAGFSRRVAFSEIEGEEFNLSVSRYIEQSRQVFADIDVNQIRSERMQLNSELSDLETCLARLLVEISEA